MAASVPLPISSRRKFPTLPVQISSFVKGILKSATYNNAHREREQGVGVGGYLVDYALRRSRNRLLVRLQRVLSGAHEYLY